MASQHRIGHRDAGGYRLQLIDQFTTFAPDIEMHDDVIDALAMAVEAVSPAAIEGEYEEVEENIPRLVRVSGLCP